MVHSWHNPIKIHLHKPRHVQVARLAIILVCLTTSIVHTLRQHVPGRTRTRLNQRRAGYRSPIVLMLFMRIRVVMNLVLMFELVESDKQWMHILHVLVILVPTVVEVMVRLQTGTRLW